MIMPATITLKNIPDDIYSRLKEAAEVHHRSLNSEVIACLEQTLLPSRVPLQERLSRARELRQKLEAGKFAASEIDQAIDQGRP
jgi:plasmid stability protein